MRKLLAVLFLSLPLYASSVNELRANIVSMIATNILHSSSISIFIADDDFKSVFWKRPIKKVYNCEDADIIITNSKDKHPSKCFENALILMTNYREYKKTPDAIGTMFWQKGRAQIVLSAKRLKELSIKLGEQFEPYIE